MVFSSKSSGFTLIEVLVVIATIALLSAILFPVFSRARENARRVSCSSNLRQIGLGLTQYTQDYDDQMPGRYEGGVATLQNILQPYLKSYQIFQCPSNQQNTRTMNDDPTGLSHVSYAPNTREITAGSDNGGIFAKNFPDAANTAPVSLATIPAPSSTIAMCEVNGTASDFSVTQTYFATLTSCSVNPSDNTPCLSAHHLKTSNYLFADGHVKALHPAKTLLPTNLWNRNDNAAFSSADNANALLIVQQSAAYSKG